MPRPFSALSEEFNASVKQYVNEAIPVEVLTAKFSILISHKARDPEQKKLIVGAMYEGGLQWLKKLAEPKTGVEYSSPDKMATLFSRLLADDSIRYIPSGAAEEMADVGLDLLRKAEDPKAGGSLQGYLVKLATQAQAVADKVSAVQATMRAEVSTSQDITVKKLEVRPRDDKFSL